MAEYLIQSETLDDIADAINAKTGGSSAMTPAQMVTAIGSISGGGVTQTISFLDWTRKGSTNVGLFQSSTTRIACEHALYKCQSVAIPAGVEVAFGAATYPKITNNIAAAGASFVGFWNGTNYADSFTWFNSSTIDLTDFLNWNDYYFVMFLRHHDNSDIAPSEGNGVVVSYNLSDGATIDFGG